MESYSHFMYFLSLTFKMPCLPSFTIIKYVSINGFTSVIFSLNGTKMFPSIVLISIYPITLATIISLFMIFVLS